MPPNSCAVAAIFVIYRTIAVIGCAFMNVMRAVFAQGLAKTTAATLQAEYCRQLAAFDISA